jgi:hypothetical protein
MERHSPPFGELPGPIRSDELRWKSGSAALILGNPLALSSGLFASLWVVARSASPSRLSFSFEGGTSDGRLDVRLRSAGSPDVGANLATGSRGWDDGIDASQYTLWFPIQIDALAGAIEIAVAWPAEGLTEQSLILPADRIQAAADRAIVL